MTKEDRFIEIIENLLETLDTSIKIIEEQRELNIKMYNHLLTNLKKKKVKKI